MSAFWLEQMTGDFLAGDSSCVFVVLVEMRKGGFGVLFQLNSFYLCCTIFFWGRGALSNSCKMAFDCTNLVGSMTRARINRKYITGMH